jgi:hypothetical protein
MDYVIMFLIFGSVISFFVYMSITSRIEWEKRKMLGFMKEVPLSDDCIEARRQLMVFLNDRYWNINSAFSDSKSGMDGNFFTLMDSHDIPDLIRYVHLCGCRITIEEVADHDVEDPKNTPEVLKKFHTDLRKARAERIDRKYRR